MPGQAPEESNEPRIALCCVAKSGSENMTDWINHHLDLGFDHIYIYNDGTLNGFQSILEDYPDTVPLEKVDFIDFPIVQEKDYVVSSYADCYRKHKNEYGWIAFIDADDYIMSTTGQPIDDIFRKTPQYRNFEVVRLNMVDFTDFLQLTRDFDFQSDQLIFGESLKTTKKMAKSIVNCKTKGILMGTYTPTRNGKHLSQCLPNLEPVFDNSKNNARSGMDVDKSDTSILYLTPNQLEVRWRKWKLSRGF